MLDSPGTKGRKTVYLPEGSNTVVHEREEYTVTANEGSCSQNLNGKIY